MTKSTQPPKNPNHQRDSRRLAQAIAENLNRRVLEEHARDIAAYQAIKARGETPPAWLAHLVENADE